MRLLLLTPLLAIACKATPTPSDAPDTATPVPSDTDPATVVPPPDCAAYTFNGLVYNCDTLDRCDNAAENLSARLACCDCDPSLCLADPTCPPPDPQDDVPTYIPPPPAPPEHSACMTCHNGANNANPVYSGTGISNPHPFGSAAYIDCTGCHGGDGTPGNNRQDAHVPAPPNWDDQTFVANNETGQTAYFNYRTFTGVDKFEPWTDTRAAHAGETVDPLDYIQFMNPGDTRAVSQGRSCGTTGCHGEEHADWVEKYPINTQVGFFSATSFSMGADNYMNYDEWNSTAADLAIRDVSDPELLTIDPNQIGRVPALTEYPSADYAKYGAFGGQNFYQNQQLLAANLDGDIHAAAINGYEVGQVISGSNLERLVQTVIDGNCGDCHGTHRGANNRYADFRSSGCTSCHMEYSVDGKSRSTDVNVPKYEPANPDAIAAPERSHVDSHQIRNVAKVLGNGGFVRGVSDYACVGCHQGSNRTVLQFWGIRMDQNQDVVNNFQYPENPFNYTTTQFDARLYNPALQNDTFNGRNFNQHLLFEDYDNDNRDDTPADVHYEAGFGCIDCHGSADMHGGTDGMTKIGIVSHQSQATFITCESCHGDLDSYPTTVACVDYLGNTAECATDRIGNPLRNVTKQGNNFMVNLRVLGGSKFVPLTRDTVNINAQVPNPSRVGQFVYSPNASYAMGRLDGDTATGVGPQQTNPALGNQNSGFTHLDTLDCNACHAAWTNDCIGCHLTGIYDENPANYFFSNVTGERVVMNFAAEFTYQSPTLGYLMVGTKGKITRGQSGMKMFFKYIDFQQNTSNVYAFTDKVGNGNNPAVDGRNDFGALAHNKIAPHSVRGRVTDNNEGGFTCSACHNTVAGLADDFNNDGVTNLEDWENFRNDYDNQNFANLDFVLLQEVIGLNTGNYLEHPIKVGMMAGLGSGLYLFDNNGCPVNPLDANANRVFCDGTAPADLFADTVNNVTYDLDRIAEFTGVANASFSQPIVDNIAQGVQLRNGSNYPALAGTLGRTIIEDLTDPNVGWVLDSWIDTNGVGQGDSILYQFDIVQ